MGDRQLVADRDCDQREHDQRQRPCAPPADGGGVVGCLGDLGADALGALEVGPPERDGSREGDRQREQSLDLERLAGERVAGRQYGLAERDDEEQPEALDQMPARDFGVLDVDASATPRQPVQGPDAAWVATTTSARPGREARVAVGDRAGHPEAAGEQLPDEVVDEVLALRPAPQGHDQERGSPGLQEQVLRSRGVEIQEYDMPDLKTVDGVADLGFALMAWIVDPHGNALAIMQLK